jgi:hypothetical protein
MFDPLVSTWSRSRQDLYLGFGPRASRDVPEADMARNGHSPPRVEYPPLPTAASRGAGDGDAMLSIALALGALLMFVLILYIAS